MERERAFHLILTPTFILLGLLPFISTFYPPSRLFGENIINYNQWNADPNKLYKFIQLLDYNL